MSQISAKLVMELRDSTNLPMMKCKQALEAANGDKAAAIDWLRKQGLAAKDKFAGRETPNGSIGMALGTGKGVLVLLGCQTDFVANNETFKEFAKQLADLALASGVTSADELKTKKVGEMTVDEAITAKIQQIGENIVLAQVTAISGAVVAGYNHGGRIATIVTGSGGEKMRTVALHIASASPAPVALDRTQVDPAIVNKEREILAALPDVAAKPEAMRPKIVEGKLGRFYKENVLLEQEILLDGEKGESVEAYAKRNGFSLTGFIRLAV